MFEKNDLNKLKQMVKNIFKHNEMVELAEKFNEKIFSIYEHFDDKDFL